MSQPLIQLGFSGALQELVADVDWRSLLMAVGVVGILGVGAAFRFSLPAMRSYRFARRHGLNAPFLEHLGILLRGTDPGDIVLAAAVAQRHNLDLGLGRLETHTLRGGRVFPLLHAMLAARRSGFAVTFDEVSSAELIDLDVEAIVRDGLAPSQLKTPEEREPYLGTAQRDVEADRQRALAELV